MRHVVFMAQTPLIRRLALPLLIGAAMVLAYALGIHKYFTLQAIAENRASLEAFRQSNALLAGLLFFAAYVGVVALSLPGAAVLTILGGFLFGWFFGGLITVLAATIGAILIFQIARSALGAGLAKRAGPFLSRLKDGFEKDAFNYLLFLRLVPAFPFWLVNIAPAVSNVSLRTFSLATLLGIIPGTFAFSFVGQGLGSVIDAQAAAHATCVAQNTAANCPFNLELSSLVTREVIYALAALGIVSIIPVLMKKWKNTHAL
jgi:uncharacterized membrane protein YdjX (TVP38/TMEM64 family)